MAVTQAAENFGDEWGLTYLRGGIHIYKFPGQDIYMYVYTCVNVCIY